MMKTKALFPLTAFSISHPLITIAAYIIVSAVIIFLAFTKGFHVDTDPENMLSRTEAARVYHNRVKEIFDVEDVIVCGFVDDKNPDGVFTPKMLNRIAELVDKLSEMEGVIFDDVIGPTTTDDIWTDSDGTLIIDRFMRGNVSSREEALYIRDRLLKNPLLSGKMVSFDGRSLALFIPLEAKNYSYKVARQIKQLMSDLKDKMFITGLPVAEDTFGVEMFKQMLIAGPLAMALVILLMQLFIHNLPLVLMSTVVPFGSIIVSMGLLIIFGFPIHIMSSMIPIFIIPSTIGDSVHFLSEFREKLSEGLQDRIMAIKEVFSSIWSPLLYTSLTTAAGFASLALTPIPPVQAFGIFIAVGVLWAWLMVVSLLPAVVVLMPQSWFASLESRQGFNDSVKAAVRNLGNFVVKKSRIIIGLFAALIILVGLGLLRLKVNDNPVKWFDRRHPIRQADTILNERFGGTYIAYLVFEGDEDGAMLRPEVLSYIEGLQRKLEGRFDVVGKTSSVVDIIKKMSYELHNEDEAYNCLPESQNAVAQYVFLYQNSGDPDDLIKFLDFNNRRANVWIQFKSGDNIYMTTVKRFVEEYIKDHPLPKGVTINWAGLNYINVVWQNKMVKGMLGSFISSFCLVLILMVIMFRSIKYGALSILPMTVSVIAIYGVMGWIGKDFDMPAAVLSALTLGLAVDFSIHFLERVRQGLRETRDISAALAKVFGESAVAIFKAMIIVGIAFLPLTLSSLVPYKTVGIFMSAITFLSGITTLVILAAILALPKKRGGV